MSMARLWRVSRYAFAVSLVAFVGVSWAANDGPPSNVAKAPPPVTSLAARGAAKATPYAQRRGAGTARALALAEVTYPTPASASATELLQAAEDYGYYADWPHYRQYLEQVASSYPGTYEAGRALALLADHLVSIGEAAQADAISAELAGYASKEIQAFTQLVKTAGTAERAKQYDVVEQALAAYANAWKGTATGGWAALRLGDLYRFSTDDYEDAIATFQRASEDWKGSPIAEEALVSLAETLNWSESGRLAEAQAAYEEVLRTASTPAIQVRALLGLGDMLSERGQYDLAIETLSQLIAAYPTHPCAAQAYSLRSIAAEKSGDWETAVADMRAYLTYPSSGQAARARAHWLLAKDAHRKGDFDTAEAEFSTLAKLADESRHTVEFRGRAQAGLAACAQERGDLRGAMEHYLAAADVEYYPELEAVYLFIATDLAEQLGDGATRAQIIDRMVAELPGSYLTAQLVGHELLPPPGI